MCIIIWCTLAVIVVLAIVFLLFMNQPSFGRSPRGGRLERMKRSSHYSDGSFHNEHQTPLLTTDKSRINGLLEFALKKEVGLIPDTALQVVRTEIRSIEADEDFLIWFGHSSYLIQIDGKCILVDPVFCVASPLSFINKPFKGTDVYLPEDMPDIDYLVITHDHWDHLDYQTVQELKPRIRKVICGLGVGEHFEYWGFEKERIVELDWRENADLDAGFTIHCLPTRHYSGRGLTSNQTLWASFLVETPSQKIYIGGDSGYDTHFAEIGKRFPGINLAILENGQYNEEWKYIHLMPRDLIQAARDLRAEKILTVHHSKYALAKHRWDEPLRNVLNIPENSSQDVLMPKIGEVVELEKEE